MRRRGEDASRAAGLLHRMNIGLLCDHSRLKECSSSLAIMRKFVATGVQEGSPYCVAKNLHISSGCLSSFEGSNGCSHLIHLSWFEPDV